MIDDASGTDDESAAESDVLGDLVRAAELLQADAAAEARTVLEQALAVRPSSVRVQNLLALSYFKLGLFDKAETLYLDLLQTHPDDIALRVNLGLVSLKKGRSDDAITSFQSVLDRVPGHPKATNYLGLAYAQRGELERAKELFLRAGNTALAERMSAPSGSEGLHDVGDAAIAVIDAQDQPFAPAEPSSGPSGGWRASGPGRVADVIVPAFEPPPIPGTAAPTSEAEPLPVAAGPFAVSRTLLRIDVERELFVRLDGVIATFGRFEWKPVYKRFRGRTTEKFFGDSNRRVLQASGRGQIWIGAQERRFEVLEIDAEPTYLREDALFAFESSVEFENGRISSKEAGDLPLANLRSSGRAVVVARHGVRTVSVLKDAPCQVPVEGLLGWRGALTPRLVALGAEGAGIAAVELAGEGRVLLDTAA